jgi:hypothetical protein
MDDDKLLKELNEVDMQANSSSTCSHNALGHAPKLSAADLVDLKEDLYTDPDAAIEKNMAVFNRKFEVQKRQIVQVVVFIAMILNSRIHREELSRMVRREGDRIISAVTGGPHERIIDPVSRALPLSISPSTPIRMFTTSGKK